MEKGLIISLLTGGEQIDMNIKIMLPEFCNNNQGVLFTEEICFTERSDLCVYKSRRIVGNLTQSGVVLVSLVGPAFVPSVTIGI